MDLRPLGILSRDLLESPDAADYVWVFDVTAGKWKRAIVSSFRYSNQRVVSPTAISADQNDYTPSGLGVADALSITATSYPTMTGLAAQVDGTILQIQVVSGILTLLAQHSGSAAANRFFFGASAAIALGAGESVTLRYSGSLSRWVLYAAASRDTTGLSLQQRRWYWETLDQYSDAQSSVSGTSASATAGGGWGNLTEAILYTGTTTTGRAGIGSASLARFKPQGGGVWRWSGTIWSASGNSTASERFTVRLGLLDSISGEPTDGVYFRYVDNANGGKVAAVCRSNGTETVVDTGVDPGVDVGSYIYGTILAIPSRGIADFWLGNGADAGSLAWKCRVSSNFPNGGRDYGLGGSVVKSVGTTNRQFSFYMQSLDVLTEAF